MCFRTVHIDLGAPTSAENAFGPLHDFNKQDAEWEIHNTHDNFNWRDQSRRNLDWSYKSYSWDF